MPLLRGRLLSELPFLNEQLLDTTQSLCKANVCAETLRENHYNHYKCKFKSSNTKHNKTQPPTSKPFNKSVPSLTTALLDPKPLP